MPSPRIQGPAERMGIVASLPAGQISDESLLESERDITRLVSGLDLGRVALLDTEFRVPYSRGEAQRATFIDEHEFRLGREDGRHDLRFGQMMINGRGLHERPVFVGAKSFSGATDKHPDELLAREWATTNYLNSVSDRQLAYLPLGVWRTARGINHFLTLYENDVISYDNVFWADLEGTPEALRPKTVEHAFEDCIRGLGYLHGVGIVHHDAEAKNLAANLSGVRFVDLESAGLLPRNGQEIEDSERTINLIRSDLETFFDSTMQVDDNRSHIATVLAKPRFDAALAKFYRAGLRQAKADTGIKMPALPVASPEYFKQNIDHLLEIANRPKPTA